MTTGPTDIPNLDEIKDKAAEALRNPSPEVEQAIETTKSFYNRHKNTITLAALCFVAYKVEKRMVRKVVTKALKETPVTIDVGRYMNDYQTWYQTYQSIV